MINSKDSFKNKEKILPIFLFIFCAILTLILFPICWSIAIQEVNVCEFEKTLYIYLPFIPIGTFFFSLDL